MNERQLERNKAAAELLGSLDEDLTSADLADQAAYSRAQYYRIVGRRLGDKPIASRRRLLLERAAYELLHTRKSTTEIAFDACFRSLEGFGRAFRKAYGLAPSKFRRLRADEYRLDLGERLHYVPAPSVATHGKGDKPMNATERMVEHHCLLMNKMIDHCGNLPAERLDEPIKAAGILPWTDEVPTLRRLLGKSCAFAAPWMEAINGIKSDYAPTDLKAMKSAVDLSRSGFFDILRAVEEDGSWDLTFVDSVCEPPEVFSYGGVIGHMLSFSAYRRMALLQEFKALGFNDLGSGDPIEYDRQSSA